MMSQNMSIRQLVHCSLISTFCRCLRCESQPSNIGDQMSNVLADRLRIPWIAGSGAVQVCRNDSGEVNLRLFHYLTSHV